MRVHMRIGFLLVLSTALLGLALLLYGLWVHPLVSRPAESPERIEEDWWELGEWVRTGNAETPNVLWLRWAATLVERRTQALHQVLVWRCEKGPGRTCQIDVGDAGELPGELLAAVYALIMWYENGGDLREDRCNLEMRPASLLLLSRLALASSGGHPQDPQVLAVLRLAMLLRDDGASAEELLLGQTLLEDALDWCASHAAGSCKAWQRTVSDDAPWLAMLARVAWCEVEAQQRVIATGAWPVQGVQRTLRAIFEPRQLQENALAKVKLALIESVGRLRTGGPDCATIARELSKDLVRLRTQLVELVNLVPDVDRLAVHLVQGQAALEARLDALWSLKAGDNPTHPAVIWLAAFRPSSQALPVDPLRAISLLERVCLAGLGTACWELSLVHARGDAGRVDPDASASWGQRACQAGIKEACVADATDHGLGVQGPGSQIR